MKTINRTVLTILPQQPFIDWANGIDDEGPRLDPDKVHATSILVPDQYDEFNFEAFLKRRYKEIFEAELDSWMTDPDLWPAKRDFPTFLKWFKIIVSDTVYEMGKGPIRIEDY